MENIDRIEKGWWWDGKGFTYGEVLWFFIDAVFKSKPVEIKEK